MPTILVVEDDNPNLFVAAFETMGYDVILAMRGDTAIELARERKPDVILMDIRLPGLNGLEAIQAIREFDKRVPIFAITAYSDRWTREAALNAGANLYRAKPVDLKILHKQIADLLEDSNALHVNG